VVGVLWRPLGVPAHIGFGQREAEHQPLRAPAIPLEVRLRYDYRVVEQRLRAFSSA
jgi:hypothetical protein